MTNLSLNTLVEAVINNYGNDINGKEYELYCKYINMCAYENDLFNLKIKMIAGIDEAGRGPLAGPVVAASVILPNDFYLPGLDDSKKLSAEKREYFYEKIIKNAVSYGTGIVDVPDIDRLNIYRSTQLAMIKAVADLKIKPDHLLIDAMKLHTDIPHTSIIKGDQKSVSIASASIIAKVTRDRYMEQLDEKYPQYGFKRNKGYGTKEHIAALYRYGITAVHRKTFAPVSQLFKSESDLFNF